MGQLHNYKLDEHLVAAVFALEVVALAYIVPLLDNFRLLNRSSFGHLFKPSARVISQQLIGYVGLDELTGL